MLNKKVFLYIKLKRNFQGEFSQGSFLGKFSARRKLSGGVFLEK